MPKGKILVVDDEPDVRETIRIQLETANYNVLEAENGEEAIKVLRSENNMVNVGVILCDIRMPKVNGLECIQFFRQEAPGIPIVVVTAYPDPEMAANLMAAGVKDYLVKPVEREKLLGVVGELVAAGKDFEF
jgi:two-component system chemotaxis response regulator CheY